MSQVATGSDLQGGGVFSFIKAKGTPQNRAIIGSVFIALGVFFTNPELVTVRTRPAPQHPAALTPALTQPLTAKLLARPASQP